MSSDNDPTATLRYQLAVEDLDRKVPRVCPIDDGPLCHRTYRDPAAEKPLSVTVHDGTGRVIAEHTASHPNDPLAGLSLEVAGDGLARVVRSRTDHATNRSR